MKIKFLNLFANEGLFRFLESKRERFFLTGNAHMFQEDISQHKMPYRGRLEKFPNFKVTISGTDTDRAKTVLNSLSEHERRNSDTDLLCDVINKISRTVYYFGKTYLSKRVGEHEFLEIYPHNVFRLFNVYLQYVPKSDRREPTMFLRFEKTLNIFCFSIFKNSFSRLKFKIIEKFLSLGDEVTPNFVIEDGFQNRNFETSAYNQLRIRFMALITKSYAWKLRFLADEQSNEYFKIYSAYKSAIYNAQDRELIIEQLNKMFIHFKINASIKLEGIPTSDDLKKSLLQLKSGEKTFRQALDEAYLI